MDKSRKHIIPKDRYRRKRRTFNAGGGRDEEKQTGQADGQMDGHKSTIEYKGHNPHDYGDDGSTEDMQGRRENMGDTMHMAPSGGYVRSGSTRRSKGKDDGAKEADTGPDAHDHEADGISADAKNGPENVGDTMHMAPEPGPTGNTAPGERRGGRGGRRKGGGGGCLSTILLPLIAGLIGALIALALFSAFTDDTNQDEAAEGVSGNGQDEQGEEGDQQGGDGSGDAEVSDTTAAIQKARKSVVSIVNLQKIGDILPGLEQQTDSEPEEAGTGSGVIYKLTEEDAYVITNNHVVDGAQELEVTLENGTQKSAEIVGTDLWTDLAVLRMDRGEIENAIEFGDSSDLQVGEKAIAIGSPLGQAFSGSVSQGIISGLDRSVPVDIDNDGNYDWEANVLQTDAAINPGNSGGALVDQSGDLIGINSMKISMPTVEGIGFAIPVNEVQEIATQLEEQGEISRPFLGVLLQDLYTVPAEVLVNEMNLPDDVESGVIISNVEDGSPADAGGLKQFDVIVSFDGNEIANMIELRKYLYYEKEQGEEMTVGYYRNGNLQETTVTLE